MVAKKQYAVCFATLAIYTLRDVIIFGFGALICKTCSEMVRQTFYASTGCYGNL